jgi:rod shape-determining protein MreC
VVDALGLVGQVTRVFPWSSEVTLLTDRDQGAPVQNLRNGLRIIVSGQGSDNLLEVRFLDMHADLRPGDWLYTSGIDGVYPAGIPVAQVVRTEPPRHTPFARALCKPLGGVGHYRHLAVLKPLPPEPLATGPKPAPAAKTGSPRHGPR